MGLPCSVLETRAVPAAGTLRVPLSENSLLRFPILHLEKLCFRARSHNVSLAGGDGTLAVKVLGRRGPVAYLSPSCIPTASASIKGNLLKRSGCGGLWAPGRRTGTGPWSKVPDKILTRIFPISGGRRRRGLGGSAPHPGQDMGPLAAACGLSRGVRWG